MPCFRGITPYLQYLPRAASRYGAATSFICQITPHLIDALPLEAQNISLDVDCHCPVLCKVSEALYTNRLRGGRHPFSLIEPEKSLANY